MPPTISTLKYLKQFFAWSLTLSFTISARGIFPFMLVSNIFSDFDITLYQVSNSLTFYGGTSSRCSYVPVKIFPGKILSILFPYITTVKGKFLTGFSMPWKLCLDSRKTRPKKTFQKIFLFLLPFFWFQQIIYGQKRKRNSIKIVCKCSCPVNFPKLKLIFLYKRLWSLQ